ncbi:MAG: hypothetical protein H6810_02935 [Phycisphaeraceae bacterium]|nr:MAG: hypothetical protein H6810_02935 [Phycisphaeraceae bacterium]
MANDVRQSAADLLERTLGGVAPKAVVGFDGFLDTITSAVDRRRSMAPDDYEPMRAIGALGGRISGAAGRSANIELRAREVRGGGNGPLLAGALAALGVEVTLIGALGREGESESIDPAYGEVASLCARVVSIAPSARTDALEFDDGKIMFNWSANLDVVDWDLLSEKVPPETLREMCGAADLLATINWTNVGGLGSIWEGLCEHVLRPLRADAPRLFVDLSDPAKRGDDEIRAMLEQLRLFPAAVPVALGLNIAEAERLRAMLGIGDVLIKRAPGAMADAACGLREATALDVVVLHTRGAVAAADRSGGVSLETRIVEHPVLSTGAGDHFNGGYNAGRILGLPLAESLACGCDAASRFVRTGRRPTREELIAELGTPL